VQRYDLHGDASLVFVDWMTSGRHAAGERWRFSRYHSRVLITRDGCPLFHDALLLECDLDSIAERMGRVDVLLTAVLSGPLVSDAGEALFEQIAHTSIERDADLIVSASKLRRGGLLLRMAGISVEQVGRALRDGLAFLSPLLGDDPWSRKW